MAVNDDEFNALRSRVDKVSAQLEQKDAARAANTKWLVTVGAIILAALGYTNFIQLPAEAAKAAQEAVGEEVVKEAMATRDELKESAEEAEQLLLDLRKGTEHFVPKGGIVVWHPGKQYTEGGEIAAPDGWAICDGKNGTPDLRGQFLRGLAPDASVEDFLRDPDKHEGALNHDHGTHKHKLIGPGGMPVTTGETLRNETTEAPAVKASHLPPYVTVVYIMRL